MRRAKEKADAFLEQLRPLQGLLEGYCRRMLHDRSQVEDVLQSAIAQAFARFDTFAPGTNFKAWIFRFVTGAIFNQNRKRSPALIGGWPEYAAPEPTEGLAALEEALDVLLQEPEVVFDLLEDEVVEALQRLTPPERAVFLLRDLGEFSYQEIGELLSIPLGSGIGYLSRARSKLRAVLLEYANQRGLLPRTRRAPVMNCIEVRHHWMLYLDSEGDPQLHLRVRDHLTHCPACADWFARQERLERAVKARLRMAEPTSNLWGRILDRSGIRPAGGRRKPLLVAGGILAVVAVLLLTFFGWRGAGERSAPHLSDRAAELHDQWLRGEFRPDFASTSDHEVDRYLKAKAPFPVHCPPRTDVRFAVQGAGLCRLKDSQQAAYIVGRIGQTPVSILVLDRNSLSAFPHDADQLRGGHRHRCREGNYQMVSGIVAGNVVVVVSTAPPEALEKLLNAYGTYHDG